MLLPTTLKTPSFDLRLHRGVTSFVGPNGSGKTRALESVFESLDPLPTEIDPRISDSTRVKQALQSAKDAGFAFEEGRRVAFVKAPDRFGTADLVGAIDVLASRPELEVKVSETLRVLFGRRLSFDRHLGELRLRSGDASYGVSDEASGLLRLAAILTLLYDEEVGVLLIDEPEATLHPQAQSFLARELRKRAGSPHLPSEKLIVVATHSARMVELSSSSDLERVVFFRADGATPVQVRADDRDVLAGKLDEWLRQKAMGRFYKGDLLFSPRILVTEGATDVEVATAVAHRIFEDFDVSGTHIIPAGSKSRILGLTRFLQRTGKDVTILADLDVISDFDSARKYDEHSLHSGDPGETDENGPAEALAREVKRLYEAGTSELQDEILSLGFGSGKSDSARQQRGAFIALLQDQPPLAVAGDPKWIAARDQLSGVLDQLEQAGIYLFKGGELESYYPEHLQPDSDGPNKPHKYRAAEKMADEIQSMPITDVESRFPDMILALRHATNRTTIDSTRAVAERALAVLPRLLFSMDADATDDELLALARSQSGYLADLFRFENRSTDSERRLFVRLTASGLAASVFPIEVSEADNLPLLLRETATRQTLETDQTAQTPELSGTDSEISKVVQAFEDALQALPDQYQQRLDEIRAEHPAFLQTLNSLVSQACEIASRVINNNRSHFMRFTEAGSTFDYKALQEHERQDCWYLHDTSRDQANDLKKAIKYPSIDRILSHTHISQTIDLYETIKRPLINAWDTPVFISAIQEVERAVATYLVECEQAVEAAKAKARSIVDSIPEPVWYWDVHTDQAPLTMPEECLGLLGESS